MDDKLKHLLKIVIEDVIEAGEPVGSQYVVEEHQLDVSPATIRNWFAELDERGFLHQPHTSSGRLPTEKGYKLYLDELMDRKPLDKRGKQELERSMQEAKETDRRLKSAAKAMADLVNDAVVLGLGDADTFYTGLSKLFSQPEFRDWNRVMDVGGVLDKLDDVLRTVRRQRFAEPTALIGSDCPFGSACGSIFMTTKGGQLVGILGPMRMDYRTGFALLDALQPLMRA